MWKGTLFLKTKTRRVKDLVQSLNDIELVTADKAANLMLGHNNMDAMTRKVSESSEKRSSLGNICTSRQLSSDEAISSQTQK